MCWGWGRDLIEEGAVRCRQEVVRPSPALLRGAVGEGGTTAVFRDLLTFSGLCVQGLSYLVCLGCYNKLQQSADLK